MPGKLLEPRVIFYIETDTRDKILLGNLERAAKQIWDRVERIYSNRKILGISVKVIKFRSISYQYRTSLIVKLLVCTSLDTLSHFAREYQLRENESKPILIYEILVGQLRKLEIDLDNALEIQIEESIVIG